MTSPDETATTTKPGPLPFLDEAPIQRVLCVAAHPDDLEYGASAAVAKWTARGARVSYLLLTGGEAGMPSRRPAEAGPLRREEQIAACRAVGVDPTDLRILDFPDGLLEHTPALRKAIAARIREFRPDTVLAQTWELEVGWGLNHVDHRVTGLATVDAIRDAGNAWIFQELGAHGLEPHEVARLVTFGGATTHLVDVTGEPVERGVASLAAHRAYFEDIGGEFDPRAMIDAMTTGPAERSGDGAVTHALAVAVHTL